MRIFISAGEPSGDQHSAELISELRSQHPTVQVEGFGGPHMQRAGASILFDLTTLAVMGILRVLPLLRQFRSLVKQAERHFETSPPDAVVLVDFPGFNWWIAKAAKRRGIPVYYYLPPQLWAWAPWRISKVRRFVDHVICALPFEFDWYSDRGVSCTWVGHPFFDEVSGKSLDEDLVKSLRGQRSPVVGLLPGSRNHEVERNFPVMLDVVNRVEQSMPGVRWVVGNYRAQQMADCQTLVAESRLDADISFHAEKTSEVIEAADCCLMVSGSISLELLARKTPAAVLYRISRLSKLGAGLLMNCPFITLTNLIAGKQLMPEYISAGSPTADVQSISEWLLECLQSQETLEMRRRSLTELAEKVAIPGASGRAAELILRLQAESSGGFSSPHESAA